MTKDHACFVHMCTCTQAEIVAQVQRTITATRKAVDWAPFESDAEDAAREALVELNALVDAMQRAGLVG